MIGEANAGETAQRAGADAMIETFIFAVEFEVSSE
jgi:hypothetical protein